MVSDLKTGATIILFVGVCDVVCVKLLTVQHRVTFGCLQTDALGQLQTM